MKELKLENLSKEILVVTSGYFAPLHRGHIELFKKAKELGHLTVIINNDEQLLKNKKRIFPIEDRIAVIKELKCVDEVVISIDKDSSVCKTLEMLKPDIFCKGGDRTVSNIPEKEICDRLEIKIIDGLGLKVQSSTILYENLINKPNISVK